MGFFSDIQVRICPTRTRDTDKISKHMFRAEYYKNKANAIFNYCIYNFLNHIFSIMYNVTLTRFCFEYLSDQSVIDYRDEPSIYVIVVS